MFRSMWASCDSHPTSEKLVAQIRKRTTVEWPDDKRVREAICTRGIYGTIIAKYLIVEYDRSLGMDHPEIKDITIEHIMPQAHTDSWSDVIDKTKHAKLKNLWANLVPLSSMMNSTVDSVSYEKKREFYENESMFSSTRELAKAYKVWNESAIIDRSTKLGEWAVSRWKRNY